VGVGDADGVGITEGRTDSVGVGIGAIEGKTVGDGVGVAEGLTVAGGDAEVAGVVGFATTSIEKMTELAKYGANSLTETFNVHFPIELGTTQYSSKIEQIAKV
jgi:hypothetical protein